MTEDEGLQESVLALRGLRGSYSAENQAEVIIEVIDDYSFTSKLRYIMSDNATVNDKIMEEIAVRLARDEEININEYDPLQYRIRCIGHILNLAAQALISPENDDDALLPQNNDGVSLVPSKEEIEKWRKKGPLGKLHNMVVYIQRSPQRLAEFEKYRINWHIRPLLMKAR